MPVERWSATQILALAPDAGSARSARGVSGAGKWEATGLDGEILWGSCRGSGSKPYQVCVELSEPAYRCSCPSRKFPCKHALGLLLLWSSGHDGGAPTPPWVTEWRDRRSARAATRAAPRTGPPADPAAAARRAARRDGRIADGLAELDRWLGDQVQQGLAAAEQAGHRPYETMAARLVDAQAPTAATAVRRLGRLAGVGPHWADRLLGELAMLRLLVAGHRRLDALPADLAATVRARVGYPVGADEVLATAPVRDRWTVIGQVDDVGDKVASRRTWLHGATTGRYALLLSFAAGGQGFPADVVPGTVVDADLCFYPGSPPLRALIANRHPTAPAPPGDDAAPGPGGGATTAPGAGRRAVAAGGSGGGAVVAAGSGGGAVAAAGDGVPDGETVGAALARWSAALAADPWCVSVPVLLADVAPTDDGHLAEPSGAGLPLRPGHERPWWLLAAAGGRPVTVSGEYGPAGLRPLAAWVDGRFVPAPPGLPAGSVGQRRPELPTRLLSAALAGTARQPWSDGPVEVAGRTVLPGRSAVAGGSVAAGPSAAGGSANGGSAAAGGSVDGGSADVGRSAAGRSADAGLSVVDGAGSGAGGLLAAAAVALTYRRAGLAAVTDLTPVPPAPAEERPSVPASAARRLALLLAEGALAGGQQSQQAVLAEWLRLAADRDLLAPPEELPALLDAGRRSTGIRPALAVVGGRQARWLAAQQPDWRYLLGAADADPTGDDEVWSTGTPGERLAYLRRVRRGDPVAGRRLLAETFAAEPPADRAALLGALAVGLSIEDDDLIERALGDRRKEVRQAALDLARALPESGLRRRMAQRALACVRLHGQAFGRDRLTVGAPADDDGLTRDGVDPKPPRGRGAGAWLLEQVVAATPLRVWTETFERDPAGVVGLPVADGWRYPWHRGLALATLAERDRSWALALADPELHRIGPDTEDQELTWRIYELLPPDELARRADTALRRDPTRAHHLLEMLAGDWPDELTGTVLDVIRRLAGDGGRRDGWQLAELCRLAALGLPPGHADRVARFAADLAGAQPAGAQPIGTPRREQAISQLATTLAFRHEMHREFE
ncbi:DUF5691 domain-containing protein [Solwaraspora sp. WMMD1047]|uniref:DUF5691 domain-containing protein n=1 Tax=Solwaraspora sp. WMMD1047 TaxID=3016102 RepID=UPI002418113C|nr:DUF5691 domain-containing protein [Solwaraspora sp. WMMD1047]MDG4831520.1 DUF5691 domain-containing protein [Solwaraspora sp. WMMD1047]